MATSKQADIYTTSANAVTLVWGSLRLAPITTHDKSSQCLPSYLQTGILGQTEDGYKTNTCYHQRTYVKRWPLLMLT